MCKMAPLERYKKNVQKQSRGVLWKIFFKKFPGKHLDQKLSFMKFPSYGNGYFTVSFAKFLVVKLQFRLCNSSFTKIKLNLPQMFS